LWIRIRGQRKFFTAHYLLTLSGYKSPREIYLSGSTVVLYSHPTTIVQIMIILLTKREHSVDEIGELVYIFL
jgi:hypothetical protein